MRNRDYPIDFPARAILAFEAYEESVGDDFGDDIEDFGPWYDCFAEGYMAGLIIGGGTT